MKSLSYLISHLGQMHELVAGKIRVYFNSSVDNGFHGFWYYLEIVKVLYLEFIALFAIFKDVLSRLLLFRKLIEIL